MNIVSIQSKKIIAGIIMALLVMPAVVVPERVRAAAIVAVVAPVVFIDYISCDFNLIWGCDDDGAWGGGNSVAPTVTITAPAVVDIPDAVEVTWSTTDAVSCSASGDWSGSKGTSGTEKVINPTALDSVGSHTYSLECENSQGKSGSGSVTVNVVAPSVALNAIPPTVEIPDDVKLSWTSQNTVACAASGEWSGDKAISGTEVVKTPTNPAFRGQHTYNMTCKNGADYAANASAVVSVIQVPRCTFNADPSAIIPPQSSSLEWACSYASACSINRGIGTVSAVGGARTVRPTETTEYVLTCQGPDGSRDFSATVTVGGSGRIREENP